MSHLERVLRQLSGQQRARVDAAPKPQGSEGRYTSVGEEQVLREDVTADGYQRCGGGKRLLYSP